MTVYEPFKMPDGLTGDIRLLPSPSLVAFPNALVPLQLCGPSHGALVRDTLSDDLLVATTLLEPGWERYATGCAPVSAMTCLCRVVSHSQTDVDRWNVLLAGVGRARIRRELNAEAQYRQAEVKFLEDQYADATVDLRQDLKLQLIESFQCHLPDAPTVHQQIEQLWANPLPLGQLSDVIAFNVHLPPRTKQDLLTELNVDIRAHMLLDQLTQLRNGQLMAGAPYPPSFSLN